MEAGITDKKGKTKGFSTSDVLAKPLQPLTIPFRTIDETGEAIVLGLRQSMVDIGDQGSVSTGGGMGTDFILLDWGEKSIVIRGSELLRAWVATFAPEDAERFPDEVKTLAKGDRYIAVSGGPSSRTDLWHVEDTTLDQLAWFGDGTEEGAKEMARKANAGEVEV